ncbi:ANGP4 protein, partial [Polypterus senegalus]
METGGGGWTVFQRRENGSVEFQKTWREYKMGFGDPAGEHWLGNEAVHLLTNQASYSLRIELKDWEGNQKYSLYEQFQLGSERQLYRMVLKGYSGTAGQQSSLLLSGANFSTRDSDNDNCNCKCALVLTGGMPTKVMWQAADSYKVFDSSKNKKVIHCPQLAAAL